MKLVNIKLLAGIAVFILIGGCSTNMDGSHTFGARSSLMCSLSYNEADSLVHFVPEGMAILTPKAFKVYLEENSFEGSTGTSIDPLRALQNEIQKAGYLAVNKEVSPPSKFHYYQTQRADGKRGAVITLRT